MTWYYDSGSVARVFVEARRSSRIVSSYPGPMPKTLAEGYAIQDQALGLTSQSIAGWKVGRIADELVEQFGVNRLAGPIFVDRVVETSESQAAEMPILAGFAAVEAELMMRIGSPIPDGVRPESIADYIDSVRFGIEIASSPFPDINAHGPAVTISDFGNNFGLLLGSEIADWRTRDLAAAPVVLTIDGELAGTGLAASMPDGPFGAVAFLVRLLAARRIAMPVGTWVSTGAITGVHPVSPGQAVRATFDNSYEVACRTALFTPGAEDGSA